MGVVVWEFTLSIPCFIGTYFTQGCVLPLTLFTFLASNTWSVSVRGAAYNLLALEV